MASPPLDSGQGENEAALVAVSNSASRRVCVLTLSRPKALNAISRAMAAQLFSALRDAASDPSIRAVVLTGSGRAFSAGVDIHELARMTVESAFREDWLADWNNQIEAFRKPLIAAVNGYALGGGAELALMCDMIHCSKSAQFGLPEVTLGTIPGAGGTQRLLNAVGKSRAYEMILSSDRMGAEEALSRGLVSRVFDDDKLLTGALEFAERVARQGNTALQMAKMALRASQRNLTEGLEIERKLYHMSFGTADFKEGVAAFLEKRTSNFL